MLLINIFYKSKAAHFRVILISISNLGDEVFHIFISSQRQGHGDNSDEVKCGVESRYSTRNA